MLADARVPAVLCNGALLWRSSAPATVMVADACASAVLAAALDLMRFEQADTGAPAVLADAPAAVIRADAGAPALRASAAVMLADTLAPQFV